MALTGPALSAAFVTWPLYIFTLSCLYLYRYLYIYLYRYRYRYLYLSIYLSIYLGFQLPSFKTLLVDPFTSFRTMMLIGLRRAPLGYEASNLLFLSFEHYVLPLQSLC